MFNALFFPEGPLERSLSLTSQLNITAYGALLPVSGENSAAMQHDALPDATPSRGSSLSRPAGLAIYLHLCLLMALYSLASGSSVGARLLGQNGDAPRIPTGDPTSLPACETLLCSGGLQR